MSTYLFHLHECGSVTTDHEGFDLKTDEATINYAVRAARSIIAADVMDGRLCLRCHIDVKNKSRLVARVSFKDAVALTDAN